MNFPPCVALWDWNALGMAVHLFRVRYSYDLDARRRCAGQDFSCLRDGGVDAGTLLKLSQS